MAEVAQAAEVLQRAEASAASRQIRKEGNNIKFKHIIWDFDGTLFDSYPIMASAFIETLREYGITETVFAVTAQMKNSIAAAKDYYGELYQLGDAFFELYKTTNQKAEEAFLKPFDGVVELIRNTYDAGSKHYLFTHRGNSAVRFLDKYELSQYFSEMITNKHGFPRKPSPDAILYLMRKYNFCAEDALMVGDRAIDIQSGINAGVHTCYFAEAGEPLETAEFWVSGSWV